MGEVPRLTTRERERLGHGKECVTMTDGHSVAGSRLSVRVKLRLE